MSHDEQHLGEEPQNYAEVGDETRVVMLAVRRKNFRMRGLFIFGVLVVAAIFAAYAILVTPRETDDKTVALMRGIPYSGARPAKKKNPDAKTARAHISMSARAPVSIDGGVLGEVQHYVAEFAPGVHHVDVTVGSKILRQVMRVEAGEEFRVYFDLASKTIDVELIEE